MRKYIPEQVKTIPEEAKMVFRGEIYEVFQWPQKMFDGSYETFEMLRRPDTVKIIAVLTPEEARTLGVDTTQPQLVITKQEQPRKDCFYDYPGGRVDQEDADELTAAKREMLEETGLTFRNWKLIQVQQPFNKIDWLVYTFLATGLVNKTTQQLDAGERIEVVMMSIDEANQLAKSADARYMRMKEMEDKVNFQGLMEIPEIFRY